MDDVIDLKVNKQYELHLTLPSGDKIICIAQLSGATITETALSLSRKHHDLEDKHPADIQIETDFTVISPVKQIAFKN